MERGQELLGSNGSSRRRERGVEVRKPLSSYIVRQLSDMQTMPAKRPFLVYTGCSLAKNVLKPTV